MTATVTRGAQAEALVWSACSAMTDTAARLLGEDPGLARYDLATAAVCGEPDVVAKLIAADPRRANMYFTPLGRTPLHYATFSRLGRRDPARAAGLRSVVDVLLYAGADPNLAFHHEGWVQAPIFGAAGICGDPEMTARLLEAGADPNDVGPEQRVGEALYHAAELPDPTCASLLIRAGTDPAAVTHCLGRALDFDNPAMVAAFCDAGARPGAEQLLHAVWDRRGADTVARLLANGAPVDGRDGHRLGPAQIAALWGDEDVVALLADHGADTGEPRLHLIAEFAVRDQMVLVAIRRGERDTVARLLEEGARLEGDPATGRQPLGEACWRGRPAIVAELLQRGAPTAWEDGSALGATRHGAGHCNDPQGGSTMAPQEEIDPAPYREIEALLAAHGVEGARA